MRISPRVRKLSPTLDWKLFSIINSKHKFYKAWASTIANFHNHPRLPITASDITSCSYFVPQSQYGVSIHLDVLGGKLFGSMRISPRVGPMLVVGCWRPPWSLTVTEDRRSMSVFLLYCQLSLGQMANFPALIASKSLDLWNHHVFVYSCSQAVLTVAWCLPVYR